MFGIVANVVSDKAFRTGAKVRLYGSRSGARADMVLANGLNKSGRAVFKHIALKRLENFRANTIPNVEFNAYPFYTPLYWHEKSDAQETAGKLNLIWKDLRYFSRNGDAMTRDGVPVSTAFARAVSLDAGGSYWEVSQMDILHLHKN